jgi:serine/threonine-protein kinase
MSSGTADPAAGDQIGPYRVVRRIGGGGMGVVLEAVDTALGRRVALKVISGALAQDEDFRRRFTAEARALAALDSPHVVQVHAHGEHAGRLYIATQLLPDGDLAHLLERSGPPALRVGLDLMCQVAAGLADAHEIGLLHRDLKPANILLRRRDGALAAYLADFGVARRLDAPDADNEARPVGTPAWMAPELHAGRAAGVASDIYSLGCLLWATLRGRPPYAGASDEELATAHRRQPVPQIPGGTAIVRETNRILRTAMAKDPAARPSTAASFRDDLRRAARLPEKPDARRRRNALATSLAVAVSLASGPSSAPTAVSDAEPGSAKTDRAKAKASLARALAGEGVMNPAQARCTARRWIEDVGLGSMVRAGFFDADLAYVDRDRRAMTPRIEAAASAAARACATRPGR